MQDILFAWISEMEELIKLMLALAFAKSSVQFYIGWSEGKVVGQ